MISQKFDFKYSIQLIFLLAEENVLQRNSLVFEDVFLFMQKYSKASYEKIACNWNQRKKRRKRGHWQ
jgi:hypothetical protein